MRNPRPSGEYAMIGIPNSRAACKSPSSTVDGCQQFLQESTQTIRTALNVRGPWRVLDLQCGNFGNLQKRKQNGINISFCHTERQRVERSYLGSFPQRLCTRLRDSDVFEFALLSQFFECPVRLFQAPASSITSNKFLSIH